MTSTTGGKEQSHPTPAAPEGTTSQLPTTEEQQRLETLRAIAGETTIGTHERALEVAPRAVGQLFGALEGDELRDAVTQLVATLEHEVRNVSVLAATILISLGIRSDDEMLVPLASRASR